MIDWDNIQPKGLMIPVRNLRQGDTLIFTSGSSFMFLTAAHYPQRRRENPELGDIILTHADGNGFAFPFRWNHDEARVRDDICDVTYCMRGHTQERDWMRLCDKHTEELDNYDATR